MQKNAFFSHKKPGSNNVLSLEGDWKIANSLKNNCPFFFKMTSTINMTHDSDDKQCCCAHQICPGHFSVGQTLRTDENVVLLFADTHLKQNENIKFPSLKKSLLL